MPNDSHAEDILNFVAACDDEVALIAVTDIHGGTLRAKGALMAVTRDKAIGYVSAGCVDADIIFQARQTLDSGEVTDLVYGDGSPFKDIQLPCGGAIHIRIVPNPERNHIKSVTETLQSRQAATLSLGDIDLPYAPKLRLRVIGRGAPFTALANIAIQSGFEVHGQSPDESLAQEGFVRFDHLTTPNNPPPVSDDPWTAIIVLFHDHDWEPALLTQALSSDAFYIGAMGSDRTHAIRLEKLAAMGTQNAEQIRGPIGLIPAMRDAQRLAISILAEIIDAAQKQGRLS